MKSMVNDLYLFICFACRRLGIPGYQIHQIYLSKQKLIYIPIPKNACTSIMHALHEIEFGYAYDHQNHKKQGYRDIHDYYQKREYSFTGVTKLNAQKGTITFVVIRDPVKRLISCYRNRVVGLKDLEKSRIELENRELPVKPDLNTFVLKLDEYQKANKIIEHHSRPQSEFLDNSLTYFDKIFPIEEFKLVKKLLKKYKPDLIMRTAKSGGPSFSLNDLSREALDAAIAFYHQDYELLSSYYKPEEIRKEYERSEINLKNG